MASFNLTNFKGFKFFGVTGYLVWGGDEYVGTHIRPCVIIWQIQLGAVQILYLKQPLFSIICLTASSHNRDFVN